MPQQHATDIGKETETQRQEQMQVLSTRRVTATIYNTIGTTKEGKGQCNKLSRSKSAGAKDGVVAATEAIIQPS